MHRFATPMPGSFNTINTARAQAMRSRHQTSRRRRPRPCGHWSSANAAQEGININELRFSANKCWQMQSARSRGTQDGRKIGLCFADTLRVNHATKINEGGAQGTKVRANRKEKSAPSPAPECRSCAAFPAARLANTQTNAVSLKAKEMHR